MNLKKTGLIIFAVGIIIILFNFFIKLLGVTYYTAAREYFSEAGIFLIVMGGVMWIHGWSSQK